MGYDDDTTQAILRSLFGELNNRIDHLKDEMADKVDAVKDKVDAIKSDTAGMNALVTRNTEDIQKLYTGLGNHATAITAVTNTQANCQARKAQEAGSLPGNRSEKGNNIIAIVFGMVSVIAAIIAVLALIKQ